MFDESYEGRRLIAPVFLVRSEAEAEALLSLGIASTVEIERLDGANVVIVPSADEQGREWAHDCRVRLTGVAGSVTTIDVSPYCEPGWTIRDWLGAVVTDAETAGRARTRLHEIAYLQRFRTIPMRPGDDGFPAKSRRAYRAGRISRAEHLANLVEHRLVREQRGPSLSEAELIEALHEVFETTVEGSTDDSVSEPEPQESGSEPESL